MWKLSARFHQLFLFRRENSRYVFRLRVKSLDETIKRNNTVGLRRFVAEYSCNASRVEARDFLISFIFPVFGYVRYFHACEISLAIRENFHLRNFEAVLSTTNVTDLSERDMFHSRRPISFQRKAVHTRFRKRKREKSEHQKHRKTIK